VADAPPLPSSRRAFLAATVVAVPAITVGTNSCVRTLDDLHREEAINLAWRTRLDGGPNSTDDDGDAGAAYDSAFLDKVDALPLTPENAAIRARAVARAWSGALDRMFSTETTDMRLVTQILKCLAGGQT